MRITGLGHAGMFIETAGGSDPLRPMGRARVLRILVPVPRQPAAWTGSASARPTSCTSRTGTATTSTRALLQTYVPKDIEVLLPDYPTDDLETDLRELGYENIIYAPAGEVIERGDAASSW